MSNEYKDWIKENSKIICDKIARKEALSADEVRYLNYVDYSKDDIKEIERDVISHGRWTDTIEIVFKVNATSKVYSVTFEQGLTECQEDEYEEQYAVEMEPYVETVIRWKARDNCGDGFIHNSQEEYWNAE